MDLFTYNSRYIDQGSDEKVYDPLAVEILPDTLFIAAWTTCDKSDNGQNENEKIVDDGCKGMFSSKDRFRGEMVKIILYKNVPARITSFLYDIMHVRDVESHTATVLIPPTKLVISVIHLS